MTADEVDEVAPFLLSGDQVEEYERDGFLVIRGVIDAATLAGVARSFAGVVDSLAQRWRQRGLVPDELAGLPFGHRYLQLLRSARTLSVPVAWRRALVSPAVYALWQRPEIVGAVRSVVGPELFAHGVWNGRPHDPLGLAKPVRWHQDAHYYKAWAPADGRLVSVWIPLVKVDEPSSCLQLIPGSHRAGWIGRVRGEYGEYTVSDEVIEGASPVTLEMDVGDFVMFADTTLHRSTANRSDSVRWSIDIRFGAASPEIMGKSPRGYYCHSADDPDRVESYSTWADRYQYQPAELLEEMTNFEEGYDLDALRRFSDRSPYADIY